MLDKKHKKRQKIPVIFAFIDAENVKNTVRSFGYSDLNYHKLYKWLKDTLGVSRIYLYGAIAKGDTARENELKTLQRLGYVVLAKKVQIYSQRPLLQEFTCSCGLASVVKFEREGRQKANCDAELTLDVINKGVRKQYNEIIVFSCDGDFTRVYEYVVTQLRRKVTVYATFNYRTSLKVKELHKKGIIKLEDISSLLQHYGEKTVAP
jgi:uncharacterized LabA/DUF88 family protein